GGKMSIRQVTNKGPIMFSRPNLADEIGEGLVIPSFAPPAGAYDTNTGVWSGLSLASGQSVTLTLTGTIDPNATGLLTNTVTVSADRKSAVKNKSENSGAETDTMTQKAEWSVTITERKNTVV